MFNTPSLCVSQALTAMSGRFYGGRPLMVEYSPVTDFREARCRSYDEATCNRGGHCNFLHLMPVSRKLMRRLRDLQKKTFGKDKDRDREDRDRERGAADRGPNWRREASPGSDDRRDLIASWNKEKEGGGEELGC